MTTASDRPATDKSTWDAWQGNRGYGDLMRRRALGVEPEMESAKELIRLLAPVYRPGMRVLDVGCGGGHFARSLRQLDAQVRYTGMDFTGYYLAVAEDVWRHTPHVQFIGGDAYRIPVEDASFDAVTCVTVLQNLPDYRQPVQELMRVSREVVLMRLLLGELTHVIHRFEKPDAPRDFTYYNIWSSTELVGFLYQLGARRVDVLDERFGAQLAKTHPTSTYTYGDLQLNGNVLMTWKWVRVLR